MSPPTDGSANLIPTEGYALFYEADNRHQSVRKYLTGQDGPLLYLEWKLWRRFRQAQDRVRIQQEKAQRTGHRSGRRR